MKENEQEGKGNRQGCEKTFIACLSLDKCGRVPARPRSVEISCTKCGYNTVILGLYPSS